MYRFHLHSFGTFDNDHLIGPACWPHFDLFCLHAGRVGLQFTSGQSLELSPGELVLIYPHTAFSGRPLEDMAVASVQHFSLDNPADPRPPDCLADLAGLSSGFETHAGDAQLLDDIKRAIDLAGAEAADAAHAAREALHSLILITMRNGPTGSAHGPYAAMDKLQNTARWAMQQSDRSLSAVDLARHAGLSPSRFRERFQQETGATPREFLRSLRLNEGKRLLRETRLPVKEIAERCGYGDLVAFSRAFQRRFATTPARYRRESAPLG